MAKSVFMKESAELKEVSICLMEVCTMCVCVYVCVCVCGSALPQLSLKICTCYNMHAVL